MLGVVFVQAGTAAFGLAACGWEGRNDGVKAKLAGFFEPLGREGDGANFARKANLAEQYRITGNRLLGDRRDQRVDVPLIMASP